MNVYVFELRRLWRSFVAGTLTLSGVAVVLLVGLFPIYHDSRADVEQVLAGFPPQFAAAFGLTDDVFSFGGFFGLTQVYLSIVVAIFGALWGLRAVGREKTDKCMDFIVSKPVSRIGLFWAKSAAVLTGVVVSTGVFIGTVLAIRSGVEAPLPDAGRLVVAALGIGGLQLIFVGFGILIAVLAPHLRSATGIASGLGVFGFILSTLPALVEDDKFKVVSPFSYFDARSMIADGTFDGGHVAIACSLIVLSFAVACVLYVRSDVKA